jgi:hypothetical protein
MPCVGFEPKIPASEQAKIVHTLDRLATVTGNIFLANQKKLSIRKLISILTGFHMEPNEFDMHQCIIFL